MNPTSDRWAVEWSSSAGRAMARLPMKVVEAVAAFVEGPMAANPQRTTKKLHEPFEGKRSARVGKAYRIILSLDENNHVIRIEGVAHRSDAYRPG